MAVVEVNMGNIQWPARCCGCGGREFSTVTQTDKVVVWTILSITSYRQISINIPICARCAVAHIQWYISALAAIAIGFISLHFSKDPDDPSLFTYSSFFASVIFAIIAMNKKPIKILKYIQERNSLQLKIANEGIAKQMAQINKL